MKKHIWILTILFTCALSHRVFANVDYSKCMNFISEAQTGFGHSVARGIQYLPFDLQTDGKLKIHDGVTSYNYDRRKKQDVISFDRAMIFGVGIALNGSQPKTKITIQRDNKGNIVEIIS